MRNVIGRYLGVLLFLSTASCGYYKERFRALKTFEEKRSTHEAIATSVQQYRDSLECFALGCELRVEDIDIDEKLLSNFSDVNIISSKPLVIEFRPTNSIYARMWYAETADSANYVLSYPEVRANELNVRKIDEQWFFVTEDWN